MPLYKTMLKKGGYPVGISKLKGGTFYENSIDHSR